MPQARAPSIQELFLSGVRHHRAGRLKEAAGLYLRILQADPRHADALHFLGVIAHQEGRHDAAVDLIGQAIARNGHVPAFRNNLGNALKAQGKWEDAASCYGRALAQ